MQYNLIARSTKTLLAATALATCWCLPALAQSTWTGPGGTGDSGAWNTVTNWTPNGVPNAVGAEVRLDQNPGGGAVIDLLGGNFTIGEMRVNTPSSYVIGSSGGPATLSFQAAGHAAISVTQVGASNPLFVSTVNGGSAITVNLVSDTFATVATGQTLWFGDNTTLAGAGELELTGTGTVRVDGASTRTGITRLQSGTLDIRNIGALGTGMLEFTDGTLRANTSGTLANSIGVEVGGSMTTIVGNGQTVTHTGAISLGTNIGSLSFGEVGNTGTFVMASGFASFVGAPGFSVDVLGGTLRGTTSELSFFTRNAAATNVAAGATLEYLSTGVGDGRIRNVQSLGTIVTGTGATLVLGGGQAAGTITGAGAVRLTADPVFGGGVTGNLLLTGTNSYSGGTAIDAGTVLQLGNGGTTGSIVGNATNNGSLVFSRSNTYQFDGAISGTGSVTQAGSGTTILAGTNTYTGPTTVNTGTLRVNGNTSASAFTVNAGATLGGNGTVGSTTINGGVLAPGNSIGLLTVQGSLTLTAASSYMVEVSPANADRTNVTGTATLGGATLNANFAAGSYVNKQYTIVNASGGVAGTFAGPVVTNLPAGFQTNLSYDANNAYLNLALTFVPPPGAGLSANQQNVGNAIVNFFNTTGSIPIAFGGLTPAGLTQVSGETTTGSQQTTFNAMNQFMGVMTDPFIAGRGDPVSGGGNPNAFAGEGSVANAARGKARTKSERDAYAAIYTKAPPPVPSLEQRWSLWAAGFGGSQTTDGNAFVGSNGTRSSIYGSAVGADYRISPNTLAGFALAGGGTNFSVNGFGSGRSDLFQAGAFMRHNVGSAYLSGALAYGWQDVTTDRTVTVAGIDRLRAQFNGNAWSGRVEGGYRFVNQGVGWTPYAAGQFTTFELPAYAEQVIVGANTFALAYTSKSVTNTRSDLGLRTDKSFAVQNGIFTLRGRAAWAHDFNPDRTIGATFQTLPGASFVVNGARQAADAALVTGSAEMKWINGWSIAGTFESEFSNVTESYAGKGVVRYAW